MLDKIFSGLSVLFLAFLAFCFGSIMLSKNDQRTLVLDNVVGIAVANPDSAIIQIGIRAESKESKDQSANIFSSTNSELNKIFAKYSILHEDTSFQDIQFSDWSSEEKAEDGSIITKTTYSMAQSLTLRLSGEKFAKISDILKDLSVTKNVSVNSVERKVSDMEKIYEQARENGINKAKIQAEKMAENLGVNIGKVISVEVVNPYNDFSVSNADILANAKTEKIIGMESEEEYKAALKIIFEIK